MNQSDLAHLPRRCRGAYLDKCRTVRLKSNLYKVNFSEQLIVSIYTVKVTPEIPFDRPQKLDSLLGIATQDIHQRIGDYVQSGRTLFGTKIVSHRGLIHTIGLVAGYDPYSIQLKHVKTIQLSDIKSDDRHQSGIVFSFFNNMIKNFLRQANFFEVGRGGKYFNSATKRTIESAGVMSLQGYATSFSLLENGLYLRVDPIMKIICKKTALELIDELYRKHSEKTKSEKRMLIATEFAHKTVMTNYGKSKLYIIEEVLFDVTLEEHRFMIPKHGQTNLLDYYRIVYDINIKNKKQPLLRALPSNGKKKDEKEKEVILVPQLLLLTGLPEDFDEGRRRLISQKTILQPKEKLMQIQSIMDNLRTNLKGKYSFETISNNLGISIESKPTQISGKIMRTPTLLLGKNNTIEQHKVAAFNLFNKPLYNTDIELTLCIVHPSDYSVCQIQPLLMSTCRNLDLSLRLKSQKIEFNNAKTALREVEVLLLRQATRKSSNAFWFILPYSFKQNYKTIKKVALREDIQLITQVSLVSTMQKRNFASIVTKIILQIAAKIGNKPWLPSLSKEIKEKGVLLIGIQISPCNGKSVVSYCGSINKEISEFHSGYYFQEYAGALVTQMNRIVNQCLNAYIICSNDLPTEVIILKNGTAKNELSLLLTSEIKDAKAAVSNITKDSFKPNLSYIVVDCNSNQKFFLDKNKEIMNPSYGTLINSQAVSKNYDFYMIAQNCNRGTAKPTYYKLLHCDSELEQGQFEELMFGQCFNYMNWTGSIRVPSVLFYAKKLGQFVTESIGESPQCQRLMDKLYYI